MFEINFCKNEMNSTITSYIQDIKNIRTGRVSPDILKNLTIDSYGAKMALPQLCNINNLDNMTLSINLWDSSLVNSVEKALDLIVRKCRSLLCSKHRSLPFGSRLAVWVVQLAADSRSIALTCRQIS